MRTYSTSLQFSKFIQCYLGIELLVPKFSLLKTHSSLHQQIHLSMKALEMQKPDFILCT